MESWIIGVTSGIVAAIVYGLLFAQREEAIRSRLRRATGGLFRHLYVRALIQAVRGGAGVADSRHLAVLVVLVIFTAGVWTQATVQSVRGNVDHLVQRAHALQHTPAAAAASSIVGDPHRLLREVERAHTDEINAVASHADAIQAHVRLTLAAAQVLAYLLLVAAAVGWVAWMPYVLMRRQFAHEIERFSLRMQGLATPQELANLTKAELGVRDSHTLAVYVRVMGCVAARYEMPELTRSFELWDESTEA